MCLKTLSLLEKNCKIASAVGTLPRFVTSLASGYGLCPQTSTLFRTYYYKLSQHAFLVQTRMLQKE